jgi:hypothetical protein
MEIQSGNRQMEEFCLLEKKKHFAFSAFFTDFEWLGPVKEVRKISFFGDWDKQNHPLERFPGWVKNGKHCVSKKQDAGRGRQSRPRCGGFLV